MFSWQDVETQGITPSENVSYQVFQMDLIEMIICKKQKQNLIYIFAFLWWMHFHISPLQYCECMTYFPTLTAAVFLKIRSWTTTSSYSLHSTDISLNISMGHEFWTVAQADSVECGIAVDLHSLLPKAAPLQVWAESEAWYLLMCTTTA